MKKTQKSFLLFSICLAVIVGCSSGSDTVNNKIPTEPGAEVFILMNDGSEYEGELLRVNDSTMILCEVYNATEQDLADSIYTIYALKNYDINIIEIRVGSNSIYGIIVGGVAGSAIGAGLYKSEDKKEKSVDFLTGCCIGGLFGAFAGGIIAFIATNDEILYERAEPEVYDFEQLNIYSRYGGKEPDYLKEIK